MIVMYYYHGKNKPTAFFEGWYLRHQNGKDTLALIPAFHCDQSGTSSASLQVITNHQSWWVPFDANLFCADDKTFDVFLGQNRFCRKGVYLDIDTDDLKLRGILEYGEFTPPQYSMMGPFSLLPAMECNHGILSFGHTVSGSVLLNGCTLDFSSSTGYIEKDWGKSFPKGYVWTQCNRFGTVPCSIFISVAQIPLGAFEFTGCIASVVYGAQEMRLATYLGAKVLRVSHNEIILRQGKVLLWAQLLEFQEHPLRAPNLGGMDRIIHESAACRVRYRLFCNDVLKLDLTSRQAGFEWNNIKIC
ncbi:MAG: tocopherol cyclase family protein [Angelakisella sp.]|nr:tocopherol cyclase family protein [Angelakisella sp.]